VTPIVKVTKAKSATPFFTLMEYEKWREEKGHAANGFQIK